MLVAPRFKRKANKSIHNQLAILYLFRLRSADDPIRKLQLENEEVASQRDVYLYAC